MPKNRTNIVRLIDTSQKIFKNDNATTKDDNFSTTTSINLVTIHYINTSHPNPGQREKIKLNFYFHTSLWCLKAFKAFIKPFKTPQRSVKINI